MSERKWKPGDVVRLKTGGWPMTVGRYDAHLDVECVWFEKRHTGLALSSAAGGDDFAWDGPKYGTFHEDALEASEPLK